MASLTASLISLLYGVTSGGVLHPWRSASVISTIVVGTFGCVMFLLYEGFVASEPMIPLRIFSNRTAGSAYFSSFILGFVLWAMQYYLILYVRYLDYFQLDFVSLWLTCLSMQFLVAQNQSLLSAGISILPGTVFVPVTAIVGGLLISKLQKFKTVNSVAWVLVTIGFASMTQLRVESSKAKQYGLQVIYALGGGVVSRFSLSSQS